MSPRVLILDEPTAGLDPRGRDEILGQICEYRRKKGTTVLLVSHSMEDVARVSSRVLVMNDGQCMLCDTVERVFSRAQELSSIGLNVPQVTRVFRELRRRGYPVRENIFTATQGRDEILRVLARAKEGAQT